MTDIPAALVEKAAAALVGMATPPGYERDAARRVLAAVWPDVAAARPVVDREALAEALWERLGFPTEHEWEELASDARDDWRKDADAILASGVITDAADVRRQTAEDTLRALLSEWQELRDTLAKEENDIHAGGSTLGLTASEATATVREWIRAAIAREVGGDRG